MVASSSSSAIPQYDHHHHYHRRYYHDHDPDVSDDYHDGYADDVHGITLLGQNTTIAMILLIRIKLIGSIMQKHNGHNDIVIVVTTILFTMTIMLRRILTLMTFTQVDLLATHYYSHKFVCVAPYSTDTLLLINIPKTMLEKVIKVTMMKMMVVMLSHTGQVVITPG